LGDWGIMPMQFLCRVLASHPVAHGRVAGHKEILFLIWLSTFMEAYVACPPDSSEYAARTSKIFVALGLFNWTRASASSALCLTAISRCPNCLFQRLSCELWSLAGPAGHGRAAPLR
jgi:hypothetical protein